MLSERALPFMLLLSLVVVFYQQTRIGNFPPPPSALVGVAVVFSLLAILALLSPQVAAAFGLAVVVWLVFAYHGNLQPASSAGGGA